jgi:hypothetical protein
MRFMELNGFSVRQDRQVEFQEWVARNEEQIAGTYPGGSEFGGIYTAVFATDKDAGEFFWVEFHDSYAALDRNAALAKDPTSEMARVAAEFLRFVDPDRAAGWSRTLLKSVVDATVMDLPVD